MFNSRSLYFGLAWIKYDFQYSTLITRIVTCPILLKGAILSILVVIELITACRIVMHLIFHAYSGYSAYPKLFGLVGHTLKGQKIKK